jgi:hypothetical protein
VYLNRGHADRRTLSSIYMQKWHPWETANDVEWGLAVQRESVIHPLAEEERLTNGRLQETMLGGRKFVLDLRAISRTVRDLSDRKLPAIRKIRDLRAARQLEPVSDRTPSNEHRPPVACRVPGSEEIRTWRLASRIRARGGGCSATDLVFAHPLIPSRDADKSYTSPSSLVSATGSTRYGDSQPSLK